MKKKEGAHSAPGKSSWQQNTGRRGRAQRGRPFGFVLVSVVPGYLVLTLAVQRSSGYLGKNHRVQHRRMQI